MAVPLAFRPAFQGRLLGDPVRDPPAQRDAAAPRRSGKVVFGINQEMRDYRTNRTKDLNLVIATPGTAPTSARRPATLKELAERWKVLLTDDQRQVLADLPPITEGPTGVVLAALEAKACMTAHIKALPRLFDELNSSHLTVHANTDGALAVGFAMVNASPTFVSPDLNKWDLSQLPPGSPTTGSRTGPNGPSPSWTRSPGGPAGRTTDTTPSASSS